MPGAQAGACHGELSRRLCSDPAERLLQSGHGLMSSCFKLFADTADIVERGGSCCRPGLALLGSVFVHFSFAVKETFL